ncbi:hypothetical protein EZW88_23805, partial [Salmonella enterica subsp. enterica serovar Bredeney]|nr:hypothetical protein [Salmonella enterica subsp. enterica serovar Bredeney]
MMKVCVSNKRISERGFIHDHIMFGYSKLHSNYDTHTDRLLANCRGNLSAKQSLHMNNMLQRIGFIANSGDNNYRKLRPRSFSEPVINNNLEPVGVLHEQETVRVSKDGTANATVENLVLTKTQKEFIHNPHKRIPALNLFNEIALEHLPESIKNINCDENGEKLKVFLGIIASQKDKFTLQERGDFNKICQKFLSSGMNYNKQEKIYGLLRGLLSRYGEAALTTHYSYFIGFCICAWQQHHGINFNNHNGDEIFNKSLHACKENIDRYINKLVNAASLENIAISKAVDEYKNSVLAIPLTLKSKVSESSEPQTEKEQQIIIPREPEKSKNVLHSEGGTQPDRNFKREIKDNGDIHIHIENIGNNNGCQVPAPFLSPSDNIVDQLYNRLIQEFLNPDKPAINQKINLIKELLFPQTKTGVVSVGIDATVHGHLADAYPESGLAAAAGEGTGTGRAGGTGPESGLAAAAGEVTGTGLAGGA